MRHCNNHNNCKSLTGYSCSNLLRASKFYRWTYYSIHIPKAITTYCTYRMDSSQWINDLFFIDEGSTRNDKGQWEAVRSWEHAHSWEQTRSKRIFKLFPFSTTQSFENHRVKSKVNLVKPNTQESASNLVTRLLEGFSGLLHGVLILPSGYILSNLR